MVLKGKEITRIKSPDINPHKYDQLILGKSKKATEWIYNLFNKWSSISTCQKINVNLYLTPNTNINSKRIIDLTATSKILKLLEEKIGENK